MEKDTKYRKYLEGLKKSTKKVKMEQALKSPGAKKSYAIMSKITGVPYKGNESYEKIVKDVSKINKDTLHKTLMSGKNPYSDLVNTTNKGVSKVGEDFVKRRMSLAGAGNVLSKIPRVGKIIGAAIAGYGAAKLGEKDKKYHGGMMHKKKNGGMPKYDIGGGVQKAKEHKEKIKDVAGSMFGYIGEMSNSLKNLNPLVAGTGYAKDYIEKKIKKPKDEKAFRELPDSIKKRPRNDNRPSVQDRIRNRPERFFPPSNKRPQYLSTGGMKKYNSGSMVHVKTKIGKSKPTKIC